MRRIRFSLRFCLIATVVLAVTFAFAGSRYQESLRQVAIAEQLAASGVTIEYDGAFFPSVVSVYLASQSRVDEELRLIGQLPSIRSLTLQFAEYSDASLGYLIALKRLEDVDLKWTTVGDEGLAHLAKVSSIRSLTLNKSYPPKAAPNAKEQQITDRGLEEISKLKQLEKLVIWGANISDVGVSKLTACDQVKVLWLCDTDIDGVCLADFDRLTQLQQLDLCGTKVTSKNLEQIKHLKSLRSLSVARTQVTASEALAFQASRQGDFTVGY